MSLILKGIDLPQKGKVIKLEIEDDGTVWEEGKEWVHYGLSAIQIPKEHGRLTDSKEILTRAEQEVDGLVMSAEHLPMVIEWILDKCDTILDAEEAER